MLRVYLDWNVVSSLKRPECQEIKKFLVENRSNILIPYSPTHFADLLKSFSPENAEFESDLKTLEDICGRHLLNLDEKRNVSPELATPREFLAFKNEQKVKNTDSIYDFEAEILKLNEASRALGIGDFGSLIKGIFEREASEIPFTEQNKPLLSKMFPNLDNNSTLWDFITDYGYFSSNLMQSGPYYRQFRRMIGENGLKVDLNAGNWPQNEVIKNIDKLLEPIGFDFRSYVTEIVKIHIESYTRYDYFTTAYLVLDMVGYKSDKLSKPTNTIQNIQDDGEHAFYGAHCDYFVSIDKNLIAKSRVLYSDLQISTKVLRPDEFVQTIQSEMYSENRAGVIVNELLNLFKNEEAVNFRESGTDSDIQILLIKLKRCYFNYFNYANYSYDPKKKYVEVNMRRNYDNYSNFVFFTEIEELTRKVLNCFEEDTEKNIEVKVMNFVHNHIPSEFFWHFNGGVINFSKDADTFKPIFTVAAIIKN